MKWWNIKLFLFIIDPLNIIKICIIFDTNWLIEILNTPKIPKIHPNKLNSTSVTVANPTPNVAIPTAIPTLVDIVLEYNIYWSIIVIGEHNSFEILKSYYLMEI